MKRKNKKYFSNTTFASSNNINKSVRSRLYPDIAYQGAAEPFEDAIDYTNLGAVVKAVRIG